MCYFEYNDMQFVEENIVFDFKIKLLKANNILSNIFFQFD